MEQPIKFKKPVLLKSSSKKKKSNKESSASVTTTTTTSTITKGLMASIQNGKSSCCRLCLAPEDECVSIFKTQAADKQPIQTKIISCVQIQVNETDRLSVIICHACISYLNSWQSFKNRCDAAQRKQKIWLSSNDAKTTSSTPQNNLQQSLLKSQVNGHGNKLKPAIENAQQKFQEAQAELQRKKLQQLVQRQQQGIATGFIKSEPQSEDEEEENVMELDPTQFLAQDTSDESDDDEHSRAESTNNGNNPSILTSLGLTHVSSATPYASLANSDDSASEVSSNNGSKGQTPANCSICNMQFSNRANARRHEKNRHHFNAPAMATTGQTNANATAVKNQNTSNELMKKPKNDSIDIDYSKPELYRHLLTPSKLQFILTNLNFLEQAQDMKCKCCNKQFPSYKFFMGHMRKKYHGLPRNVCFKCLRQFESKGQFIGHLKRPGGTCPNLYRLVMADDKIPKDLFMSDTNLRTPAKDILANRVYACAICDDTFRLKSDFREHVYRTHLEVTKNRETPNASCINCNESFTESSVRRRHFNNLDCIVYIVCNTCGEQFPNQAVYLEHVYSTHLKAQDGDAGGDDLILLEEPNDENQQSNVPVAPKNTQKCPVCQKQYNNYYNVLRHMEAKHPDQVPMSYQCPECPDKKFAKQTYLREHVFKEHNKSSQNIKIDANDMWICKADDCKAYFASKAAWIDHQLSSHDSKFRCNQCDFIDNDREDFERHLEDHQEDSEQNDDNLMSDEESRDKIASSTDQNDPSDQTKSYVCRICDKRIQSKTSLQKHMIKVHQIGGELVKCTLCPAEFANDKGLKVHLWRCHEIREADYEKVLPPDLLDPYTQQQRKLKQEEEQKAMIMINEGVPTQQFVCPLCHIVYTSRDELGEHQKLVHAMDDVDVLETEDSFTSINVIKQEDEPAEPTYEQDYWFQCRFCQRSFNSSKKLTIHMNSHQEAGGPTKGQDENGCYPCKECDIIYKSKKSLWVHKNKKHPRIPEPSLCDACDKTFFDKNELVFHMQQVHPRSIPINNENSNEQGESFLTEDHWLFDSSSGTTSTPTQQMKPPSMSKKRKRPAASETPDGQFACDMCPKAFSNANALQVHRGWHFRSPDGRKVTDPSQMWMPDQTPPSKVRRTTPIITAAPQTLPICPHCNQKFASQNNLRRHIIEVHKKTQDGADIQEIAEGIHVDRTGECSRCNLTFSTLAEWIDHKITDAKNRKSSGSKGSDSTGGGGYEWNCEICLKIFTRKERLMQHMLIHLNDREMDPEVLALHNRKLRQNMNGNIHGEESTQSGDDESESEEQEEDEEDEEDQTENENEKPKTFSCELCRVDFTSSQELRAHVTDHFLNDGAIENHRSVKSDSQMNDTENDDEQADDDEEEDDEEEVESSSDESSSSNSPDEIPAPQPELPKVQPKLQIHRCRICNAAFLDNARLVECMTNHHKPTNHKCSECQLYFVGSKHLHDHENLCHS